MNVEGVSVRELLEFSDARGSVQRIVRVSDAEFIGFGEVYASVTNPGIVKAWHQQGALTNLMSCVSGRIRLVVYDARATSKTHGLLDEIEMGDEARKLVCVPPGVIYGWRAIGAVPAMIVNLTDHPHDAATSRKIDPSSGIVPYAF